MFTGFLILRAPPPVFEGDSVVLRCHAKKNIAPKTLTFYKNDQALELPHPSSELHIHHVNLQDNDEYKCTHKKPWPWENISSNMVKVQVQGMTLIILDRLIRGRLPIVVKVE